MIPLGKNTGVIILPPSLEKIGAVVELPSITNASTDWRGYESSGEWQKDMTIGFDTEACMSYTPNDNLETYLNWLIRTNQLLPAQLAFLTDNGYIGADGNVHLSARFTAYMSGTTVNGNDFEQVWSSLDTDGAVPESLWPFPLEEMNADPSNAWGIYYTHPPAAAITLGEKFLTYFDVQWRWLVSNGLGASQATFVEWLKTAPIHLAIAVCGDWNNDVPIMGCGTGAQHAVQLSHVNVGGNNDILDHYVKFDKELGSDYTLAYAVQGWVNQIPQSPSLPDNPAVVANLTQQVSILQKIVSLLKTLLSTRS